MERKLRAGRFFGSIRARVLAIVLIPSIGLLTIGAGFSGYLVAEGRRVQTFGENTRSIAASSSALLLGLQQERLLTIERLSSVPGAGAQLTAGRREVDSLLKQMQHLGPELAKSSSPGVLQAINGFAALAARLPEMRQAIDASQLPLAKAFDSYNQVLDGIATSMRSYAQSAPDSKVTNEELTALDLFVAADAMSRSVALGAAIANSALLPPSLYSEYLLRVGFYHVQLTETIPRLPTDEQKTATSLVRGQAWTQLAAAESALSVEAAARAAQASSGQIDPGTHAASLAWLAPAQQVNSTLITLYLAQGGYASKLNADSGHRTFVRSLLGGIAVLLLTLITLAIALELSRRLVRRLGRLREDTLSIAQHRLPELVSRLREGQHVDPDQTVPPLDYGQDEIGQLASAFNAAHTVAVNATIDQARAREGTQAAFLSIAHRSQVIMHRQLEVLDQAERSLDDPEQLLYLFELDHLATRARRNAENLIILGGGQPGRQWRRPVALVEVVRGAVAETEHYTRVTTTPVPDVWVEGAVVGDLVHLLAELVDNATSFSPPDSRVEVRSGMAGRGAVIEIEDQGLGIEPDRLPVINETLQHPPEFDVLALSNESRLGLFVVGRLAARLGARVTLTDSPYGGVRAVVLIPSSALTPAQPEEGQPGEAGKPLTRRQRVSWYRMADVPEQGYERLDDKPSAAAAGQAPARPAPALPSTTVADVPQSDVPQPSAAEPDAAQPDAAQPDAAQPRGAEPDAAQPSAAQPDAPLPGGTVAPVPPAPIGLPPAPPSPTPTLFLPASGRAAGDVSGAAVNAGPPPLPRRKRQAHFPPLAHAPAAEQSPVTEARSLGWPTADQSRDRMAAFQQGTREGRMSEPEEP